MNLLAKCSKSAFPDHNIFALFFAMRLRVTPVIILQNVLPWSRV